MGNQAQQSQELELWQVVGQSGNRNVQARPAKSKRSDLQTIPNLQRSGKISDYNRTRAGDSRQTDAVRVKRPRPEGPVRTGSPGNADQIRMINPNGSGTASRRVSAERAYASRTSVRRTTASRQGAARTGSVKQGMPVTSAGRAKTARPVHAEPGRQRTSSPRAGAKAQTFRKKAGRRARISQFFAIAWIIAMSAAIIFMGKAFYQSRQKSPVLKNDTTAKSFFEEGLVAGDEEQEQKPEILENFLTVSEYNRPGTKLACVNNIFVHYTANPGTSAAQNRSYFENLGQTHERAASAHFIIGYEGEIVQCIPLEEEAYAVVERNGDSISIECCFLEEDGSFTQETYDSLIKMLAWLTDKYDLEPQDILRHYDCGGKLCPIYYVEHEDAWQKLLEDVAHYTL